MADTADILRAAADLIDSGEAVTAAGALLIAVQAADHVQPGQRFDADLFEQAARTLAARLGYKVGRRPAMFLRRWSVQHSRDEIARELRQAAASPSVHGGEPLGIEAELDYLDGQDDQ